jgi:hypothetical protein
MWGGLLSTPDIDAETYAADRLGLGAELKGTRFYEPYDAFCWRAPLMIPDEGLRELWDAMRHLRKGEVKELFDTYLVGKEQERRGVIEMLRAGVSLPYMILGGTDPRLETAVATAWGWRDIVTLWEALVPVETVDTVVQFTVNNRCAIASAADIADAHRARVPLDYMMSCLEAGVSAETVVRCWRDGVPLEFAREMA